MMECLNKTSEMLMREERMNQINNENFIKRDEEASNEVIKKEKRM